MKRRAWWWSGVLALAAAAALLHGWAGPAAARARGEALFEGRTPLPGRLVGHDEDLPAAATRCANCHEPGPRGAAYALRLDGASLRGPRSRRGGPPTAYDAARLCTLLREGTDPAHVIVSTAMPRYTATDAQCAELWAWLASR